MPDMDSESDTNTKIAQGDDEVTKYTKVVTDLEDAEKEEIINITREAPMITTSCSSRALSFTSPPNPRC